MKIIEKILLFLSLSIFYYLNYILIDYGLPLFENSDEDAFKISSLSFLSIITGIKFRIIDPIIAPLFNIILILKIIFINELIVNSLPLLEIKNKIYLNPELIVYYGRLSSLIITTLSFFILFFIFKKLKINFYIFFPIFFGLLISLFATDISIRNGKNSYYLFFFLLQFYFFIKYLIKIEKFNFKSYLIFAILASLAWGVNYWAAIISIYAVLILHYNKFKFRYLQYLLIFGFILTLLGLIPNFLLSQDDLLRHLFYFNEEQSLTIATFLKIFLSKFFQSLRIIFITEWTFLLFIPLTLFYLIKRFKNKNIFIITLILFFEPIILISVAGGVVPQLRYFSGLMCLLAVLYSIILNDIYSYYGKKKIIIFFFIINTLIIFQKFSYYNKIKNLIDIDHNFYSFFISNSNLNSSTLYILDGIQYLSHRKNFENLEFYSTLHKSDIIQADKHLKDNNSSINRKMQKLRKNKNKLIINERQKNNLNIFMSSEFSIIEIDNFFEQVKGYYDYVVIMNSDNNSEISKFVKKEFELVKTNKKKKPGQIYFNHFSTIFDYASHNLIKGNYLNRNFIYGDYYYLFKMN